MAKYRIIERYDSWNAEPAYSVQTKILWFWSTMANFMDCECRFDTRQEAEAAIERLEKRQKKYVVVKIINTDSNDEATK